MHRTILVAVAAMIAVASMQGAAQQPLAPAAPATPASGSRVTDGAEPAAGRLPVRRVVLYKNGVGFFEHLGRVRGTQQVTIDFTSGQLNDVLKSLTTVDLGGGKVTGVSFNTDDPASRKLSALPLPLDEDTNMLAFLSAIRGARVEVESGGPPIAGRVLAVEQRTSGEGDKPSTTRELAVVTDGGAVRSFEVTPKLSVRVLEGELRGDIRRYLDIVSTSRQKDLRRMAIQAAGAGERQLYVSYISEVPIWKSTYRLVLPSKPGDRPLLQGWAIVDNTIGEDWTGVELSLVAGSPQSFVQALSQPLYARRPVVPLPSTVQLTPQTHEATLNATPAAAPAPPSRYAMDDMRVAPGMAGGTAGGIVGGRPDAVAPPAFRAGTSVDVAEAMSKTESAARGQDLGDLFEYRLKEPVTIRKNQSALVPIIVANVEAERVSVWNAATGPRPRTAVWVTNSTASTLDGGSFSVQEGATFTGEGLMEPVKPGERRLLSYAADLALLVDAKQDTPEPERVTSVRAAKGIVIVQRQYRDRRTYTIRNEDTKARTVVIEHPNRAGWTLTSTMKPDETSPGAYRFKVQAGAKATTTLTVEEMRPAETRYQVSNVTDDQVAMFVAQRAVTPEQEQALRGVLNRKGEIATVASEISARNAEIDRIFKDQERIRENLKALGTRAEEKALVARYTRQLDDQETRIEVLKREIGEREAKRTTLQADLDAMIQALSWGA